MFYSLGLNQILIFNNKIMMAKGARSRFYLNHTQRNACLLNLTELSLHIDYTLTSEFEYAVEIIK